MDKLCAKFHVTVSFSVILFFRFKLYSDHFRFICLRFTQNTTRTNTRTNTEQFFSEFLFDKYISMAILTFEQHKIIYLFHLSVVFTSRYKDTFTMKKKRFLLFLEHFNRFGYWVGKWDQAINEKKTTTIVLFLNLLFCVFFTEEKELLEWEKRRTKMTNERFQFFSL